MNEARWSPIASGQVELAQAAYLDEAAPET